MKENLKHIIKHYRSLCKAMGVSVSNCQAYEIIAAYYGYKSMASLLCDKEFSIHKSPNSIIKERVSKLKNLNILNPGDVSILEEYMTISINEFLVT